MALLQQPIITGHAHSSTALNCGGSAQSSLPWIGHFRHCFAKRQDVQRQSTRSSRAHSRARARVCENPFARVGVLLYLAIPDRADRQQQSQQTETGWRKRSAAGLGLSSLLCCIVSLARLIRVDPGWVYRRAAWLARGQTMATTSDGVAAREAAGPCIPEAGQPGCCLVIFIINEWWPVPGPLL